MRLAPMRPFQNVSDTQSRIIKSHGQWPSYNPGSHTAPATLWSRSNLLERPEQIEHRMQDANAPKIIEKLLKNG